MSNTTTTTQKLSFNSLPISFSSLQVPEIHLVEHESMKELSPEIDIDNITDLSATLCSAQQPPLLCPGLIRNCPVPPPIPMQWQLTVPSESELEDYNIGSLSSMDREREITLSPDDHIDDINNSESNFSFLPNIHQLSNSSSYHSNHSNISNISMTSLHSLSSYNPSSSCSSVTNTNTTEWISNEYDNNYQPQISPSYHTHSPLSMPALSLIPTPSGHTHTNTPNITQEIECQTNNDSDDINNKFHTDKKMIFETLCQFEDGSMSQMISAVDDDNNNNDDHSQSSKLQSQSQCAISTKYETKYHHLMNGFIRNLEKEIKQIIPNDINKICQQFYYEKEQKYIHLTYSIHTCHQQIIKNKDNTQELNDEQTQTQIPTFNTRPWQKNTFSGKELIEMMAIDINVANQTQFGSITMEEICDHLIEYGLIECVSYKTHFSALFANNSSNSMSSSILNWDRNQFKSSHDYLYNFTQNTLSAIEAFNDTHIQ